MTDEDKRAEQLLAAQARAAELFQAVEDRGLVAPGAGEREVSDRVRDLANEMFGPTRHWHKRIIRSGPNTLLPYRENPPDRVIDADDIAFADFGPIFEEFEADFGRTFVLGADPVKQRLRDDLPVIFQAGREAFARRPRHHRPAALRRRRGPGQPRPAGHRAAGTPATWSGSSRTRPSTAPASSPTSRPATPRRCAAPTAPGGAATGSWRSTSLTPSAASAASTSSSSTSAEDPEPLALTTAATALQVR